MIATATSLPGPIGAAAAKSFQRKQALARRWVAEKTPANKLIEPTLSLLRCIRSA